MPISRTSPPREPARDKVFIIGYQVSGLHPGGSTRIEVSVADGHVTDPGGPSETFVPTGDEYVVTLEGRAADDFIAGHPNLSGAVTDFYQKLLDDGLEAGTID